MTNKPVIETIKFTIPGTDRKLIIYINSKRENCLVNIAIASPDETTEDTLIHIDNFDNPNQLLTAIYLDNDEPTEVYRKNI